MSDLSGKEIKVPASYVEVHKVPFKTVYMNNNTRTMMLTWNSNSQFLSDEEYKQDEQKLADLVKEHRPRFLIADAHDNKFDINDELQMWYASTIVPQLERAGLEKCAILIEENLRLMSSIEEIAGNVKEIHGQQRIPHRFFSNREKAESWLHSSSN